MRGFITSVLGSNAQPGAVFATPDTYGLYMGSGHPFRWRRVTRYAPDLAVVAGTRHEALYGTAGALWRSTTEGRTWTRLSCNLGIAAATPEGGVAVSPSDQSSLYVVGQPGDYPLNHLGGYYRSTNGGKTWSRSTVGATTDNGPALQAVAVNPRDPNDVTVASYYGGVFRTGNGDEWAFTKLPGPLHPWDGQQVETLAYGAGPTPLLWAGTTNGAFRRSPDGTWVRAGLHGHGVTVFPDARLAGVALAILGYNGTSRACVRRTANTGRTWQPVHALPCTVSGISIQPSDDTIYAWTAHTIYQSTNHGKTWTKLPPLPMG